MKKGRVLQLIQLVEKMDSGETVYINSVSMASDSIRQLRQYVRNKVIIPDRGIAGKMYRDVEAVMSGDVILPQMTYIKQETAV